MVHNVHQHWRRLVPSQRVSLNSLFTPEYNRLWSTSLLRSHISTCRSFHRQSVQNARVDQGSNHQAHIPHRVVQSTRIRDYAQHQKVHSQPPSANSLGSGEHQREEMPRYRYPFVLLQVPNVLRPILFTLGIGIGSFYLAGFLNRREFQDLSQNAGRPLTSVNEAFAARKLLEQANAQKEVNWLQKHVPLSLVKLYATVKTKWLNTSDGQRAAVLVTGLNLTVFVAWQVPKAGVSLWLAKTFLHHPLSGRSYTLLTSAFSHNAFWHVALNMIALQGFIRATSDYLATKQSTNPVWRADNPDRHIRADPNPIYRTLAFYVTAATVSSLGSHLANALTLMRKASGPTFAAARASLRPSLGASGAVYALATLTALSFPETSVNLFLVVPIPITIGMSGIVALDVAGVLLRWKMFDHFAHLGGAAFGAAYFYGAPRYREWITKRRRGEGVRSR